MVNKTEGDRFRLLVESVRDYAIFMLDTSGQIISWNTGAECIMGYRASEIMGQHFACLYPSLDVQSGKPKQELQLAAVAGHCEDEGWRLRKSGVQFWASVLISTLLDEQGHLVGFSVIIRELTERRLIEEELCQANRALKIIGDCNKALVQTTDEAELLHDICHIIVKVGGYRWAWVGYANTQSLQPSLQPVAQVGYQEVPHSFTVIQRENQRFPRQSRFQSQGQPRAVPSPLGAIPEPLPPLSWLPPVPPHIIQVVMQTGQPCIIKNILTDPDFASWRTEAVKRGYSAYISLPLTHPEKDSRNNDKSLMHSLSSSPLLIFGTLNIYAAQSNSFDPKEVKLLKKIADDLAYGIQARRSRLDRQQAEAALRVSEQQLRAIFEGALEAMLISDDQGYYVDVNPSACQLFGLSKGKLIGRHITEFAESEFNFAAMWSAFLAAGWQTGEFRLHRLDGSIRDVEFAAKAGFLPSRHLFVMRDITERKQAEEELRQYRHHLEELVAIRTAAETRLIASLQETNQQLQREINERQQAQEALVQLASIVESSEDAIIGKTLDGVILSWNAGAERIYGYSAAEVKGHSIAILLMPERHLEMPRILDSIALGSSIEHYETVHIRKDGKHIDVSLTISPIKNAVGKIVGVSSIARDISALKRVEKALEQLRHQHDLILQSAGEGIFGLNLEGKITFVNPAAARMTGYDIRDLIDLSLYETLLKGKGGDSQPNQETPRFASGNPNPKIQHFPTASNSSLTPQSPIPILSTLQEGIVCHVTDDVFWRQNDTCFPVEYVSTPMREQGEIIGAVVTFKDITERQAVERMKDEFISVVSHELRTPLASLHGALGLLASGMLQTQPQRTERMLEIAITNTDRLVRLISDILDLERLRSGQIMMEKQSCNIADLMQQAADEMRAMADKAGITLSVTPVNAPILATPDRVIQTLTNLLSNAIKFSSMGSTVSLTGTIQTQKIQEKPQQSGNIPSSSLSPSLSPSLSSSLSPSSAPDFTPNTQVLIAVKDDGRGIPDDKLESIFGRFQQVDASDSRQKGGTGLGLAICRSIIQQHGGHIWVESTLGKGSTFFITLPILAENL